MIEYVDGNHSHFDMRQPDGEAGFSQPQKRPQVRLRIMCIFESGSRGPEVTEQLKLTGHADRGLHHCALKKQNLTRAISLRIMKILRIEPKNSEKKEFFFWAGEPDKLLKTQDIKIFLRKTNPSEPEKSLKINNIKNFLRKPKRTRAVVLETSRRPRKTRSLRYPAVPCSLFPVPSSLFPVFTGANH